MLTESAPLHSGLLGLAILTRKPLLFNGPVFGEGYNRSPIRIGFYVGEQLFWDFTATVAMLDSLLYPLAKLPGGSIGGRKGHAFERNLADELGEAGFDPWRVSYTVRTTSRKKDDGEIDVSVIQHNVSSS